MPLIRVTHTSWSQLSASCHAQEHGNYHEFCRLLGRLKTNYQLSELVRVAQPM